MPTSSTVQELAPCRTMLYSPGTCTLPCRTSYTIQEPAPCRTSCTVQEPSPCRTSCTVQEPALFSTSSPNQTPGP